MAMNRDGKYVTHHSVLFCRILDYRQYRYKQQKKSEEAEKQKRLAQKMATPKEMQFSARIGGIILDRMVVQSSPDAACKTSRRSC